MNDRQKRIKRITDINEYRSRRVVHDLPPRQALAIASYEAITKQVDIDIMIERIGQYVDEKR